MDKARLHGNVSESSVAIVFEKVRRRFFAGRKSLEPPAIHQKNIQPAIVVVVVESQSATGGFEQIFIFMLAAVNGFGIQPGSAAYVNEGCADGGFGLCLRLRPQRRWSPKAENVAQRENQRRAAE